MNKRIEALIDQTIHILETRDENGSIDAIVFGEAAALIAQLQSLVPSAEDHGFVPGDTVKFKQDITVGMLCNDQNNIVAYPKGTQVKVVEHYRWKGECYYRGMTVPIEGWEIHPDWIEKIS